MMTKQQEREALERIKNILADAGADSYIGMAFAGCVEDAESNIENDWALSMAGRWQSAEQKLEAVKAEADGLRAEREVLWAELDRCNARIAEAEIIRLKAKLYDFMAAAKDWRNAGQAPAFLFLERLANEEKYRTELPGRTNRRAFFIIVYFFVLRIF